MTPEQVARGLTKAMKEATIEITGRTKWSTIQALVGRGVLTTRVCHPDGNGIVFTPLGLAVRAILKGDEHDNA